MEVAMSERVSGKEILGLLGRSKWVSEKSYAGAIRLRMSRVAAMSTIASDV